MLMINSEAAAKDGVKVIEFVSNTSEKMEFDNVEAQAVERLLRSLVLCTSVSRRGLRWSAAPPFNNRCCALRVSPAV